MKNFQIRLAFKWIGLVLLFCVATLNTKAQNFMNPDLNGTVISGSSLPTGWEAIPVGDPVTTATNANVGDTPDLCNQNGPFAELGTFGNAFSGNTFVAGLRSSGFVTFNEGIMQTVSGLTVGQNYTIDFYQTVVKQISYLDGSGSWSVFMDNQLLGISEVSTSDLEFNDPNFIWDFRSVSFIPSSTSHTFKFLPTDDDPNGANSFDDITAGLRMGIDLININVDDTPVCDLELGEDITICESELPITLSTDISGSYEWSTGENTPSIEVFDNGIYTLEINSDECGILSDSITLEVENVLNEISLGEDLEVCNEEFPVFLSVEIEAELLWSTLEITDQISIDAPGTYSVTVFNSCGAVSDEIIITETSSAQVLDLQDIEVCVADLPVSVDAGLFDTYAWSTGDTGQTLNVFESGFYSLTASNSCGETSSEFSVNVISPPSSVNLGPDRAVCENLFPVLLEVPNTDDAITWSTGSNETQVSVSSEGNYSVEVSNACGASSASVFISSFVNSIEQQTFNLCQGSSVEFLGELYSEEGNYEFIESSGLEGDCGTFWNIEVSVFSQDTITDIIQLAEGESVNYNGQEFNELGEYLLLGTNENGCDQIIELFIEPRNEVFVYVPSAFTPDNNGLNEVFKPVLTFLGNLRLSGFEFEIYDRWGGLVYESVDYETVGWNGSGLKKGNYYVQDGVYNWVLKYNTTDTANREVKYGSVLIVR